MNLTAFKKSSKSNTPHYLLFGHPVSHSWSPLMHNTALKHYEIDAEYHAIDLQNNELNDLAAFLNRDMFLGGNITIPYKQVIANYLDTVDRPARQIGAVNTIVKQEYQLAGYNTDYEGFLSPLEEYEGEIVGYNAIVFGTGGASKAIVVGLLEMGIETIYLVSRSPDRISSFDGFERIKLISYNQWSTYIEEAMLIVNATPLGMQPKTNESPVRGSEKQFLADRICYDIVYNPLETKFLRQADSVGATTIGGLEMLIEQGSRSFELWTGKPFPTKIIRDRLYEEISN